MRLMTYGDQGRSGLAVQTKEGWRGRLSTDPDFPGDLMSLLKKGGDALVQACDVLGSGVSVDPDTVERRPPLPNPGKIICIGLNYRDHTAEVAFVQPDHPTVFTRFANSLVADGAPLVRPHGSDQFDFEGEVALIIGRAGRRIPYAQALDHIAGWSLFNDASVRDWQFRTTQWTLGKTVDATGGFGPWFVTADEIAPGAAGIVLETRLNGDVVQRASTDDMVFDMATLIASVSEALTLEPGDVIVTGTPAGVGMARTPPLWMKPGDLVEVAAEGLGVLRNTVAQEGDD
jgi:2-keto-4-pentenoate hydratase/2-oxohepta-3-ene-1,7-dioic acid hydratase in catechol pathway